MKLKYAVVIEKAPNNYCAYVPDLPVCLATAHTRDEMIAVIREAMEINIEFRLEKGEHVPEPRMSLRDAMTEYLSDDYDGSELVEREDDEETETAFIMVEVEVEPARAFAAAESGARMAAVGAASGRV